MIALSKTLEKIKKTFVISCKGHKCTIALDRVKPVFVALDKPKNCLLPKVPNQRNSQLLLGQDKLYISGMIQGLMMHNTTKGVCGSMHKMFGCYIDFSS